MGRHSAHNAHGPHGPDAPLADEPPAVLPKPVLPNPVPPTAVLPSAVPPNPAVPNRHRHAAPATATASKSARPHWRRHPTIPAAVLVVAMFVGADSMHLLSNVGHADTLNKGAANISGVDFSALSPNSQESAPGADSLRVSRSSRTANDNDASTIRSYTAQARPGLPSVNPDKTVPGTWVRPSAGEESSCFCMRWGVMHDGIDLAGPMNSPIVAVGDGVVVAAGPAAGFGLWVVIQHSNGDLSVYGHMYHYYVTVGEHVVAGQHIADIGDNGQSTGPHLHFGVMKGKMNGPYIDPVPWLKERGIVVGPYNPDA